MDFFFTYSYSECPLQGCKLMKKLISANAYIYFVATSNTAFLSAAQFTVSKGPKINLRGLKMIKGIIEEKTLLSYTIFIYLILAFL